MTRTNLLILIATGALVSCDTMNRPISTGDFDPLVPPGSGLVDDTFREADRIVPGQFVAAAMNNTAFFRAKPAGNADADKLLDRGTPMKVVAKDGSYVKVELDSGEVGFVPAVMIEDPSATPPEFTGDEFQVYPPIDGAMGDQLPIFDPTGLPSDEAIPTIIDPDTLAPVPPVDPAMDTPPALEPPAVDVTPAPATPLPVPAPVVEIPATEAPAAETPESEDNDKDETGD